MAQVSMPLPLNSSATQAMEREVMRLDTNNIHTAIRPLSHFEVGHVQDSIHESLAYDWAINKKFPRWLFNAFFNEHFLSVKDKQGKYAIHLNPLMDLRIGGSSDLDGTPYVNSRGLQVMGHIGQNLTFYTDLYENQARLPGYVEQWINENGVIPGQGFPKVFDSQLTTAVARDFSNATGNISFQANEFFNFQLGHGKHFIGEGHRSMLLSDNAFNYPYLKIKTSFWKLNYVNLFTQMNHLNGLNYDNFEKKFVTSHYLSINATKNFNIGLFESIVYQDSTQTYNLNYLNPIILYRPIEFAIGSGQSNALMGLTMSYKFKQKNIIYGQFILDEFKFDRILERNGWWANKYAFQLGFKAYDFLVPGLKFQTEFNYARPYIYSHRNVATNYGHYNQSLAHTLGANFIESVTLLSYQNKRWFGNVEIMYALQGRDAPNTNWGYNVLQSTSTREQD
ncbi:MAG: gliding motility protein RemB, partial [Saprospiraceae bacterium]